MLSSTSLQAALLACLAATTLAVPTSLTTAESLVSREPANPVEKRDTWCISWYRDVGCEDLLGTRCGGDDGETQPCAPIGFRDGIVVKSIDWQPISGTFLSLTETEQCGTSFPIQMFSDQDNGCSAIIYDMKYYGVTKQD
ncbi:hypothetical protein ACET3X_003061 [Alternaria dauci]|uniref:Uncharacterized protein n=1 Tax=Alternaria dauci TaxID=48095 RepID=A0ABR3UTM3_9PLEO